MESLRVKKGIEIEVNDRGETINVDVENLNFQKTLSEFIALAESEAQRVEGENPKDEIEALNLTVGVVEKMVDKFDETFGEGATRKVFGENVLPSPMAIIDFFDQLEPIVTKHQNARQKWLNDRYNARKGGRKR